MIKERPILFSTEMVKATIGGWKTQMRMLIKPQPELLENNWLNWSHEKCSTQTTINDFGKDPLNAVLDCCPYGKVGDVLWARETWLADDPLGGFPAYHYRANGYTSNEIIKSWNGHWKPSIFMPKEAARIWLEITNVKVERVQDITVNDALAEGIGDKSKYPVSYKAASNVLDKFRDLWNRINGEEPWNENPFVWAISFKVLSKTGKPVVAVNHA